MTNENQNAGKRELVIVRIFDAPRELFWKYWTESEYFKRWWGPEGFTTPVSKIDFRVGGSYHNCMKSPEGENYWSKGFYREIIELEKIIYTDSFSDAEGNLVSALYYEMSGEWPLELLVTVTLEEQEGNRTKLILKHAGFPTSEDRDLTEAGWNESFDKLTEDLKIHGQEQNTITK
jgi:uncharacterized protein YndB with AHSA1/START domain